MEFFPLPSGRFSDLWKQQIALPNKCRHDFWIDLRYAWNECIAKRPNFKKDLRWITLYYILARSGTCHSHSDCLCYRHHIFVCFASEGVNTTCTEVSQATNFCWKNKEYIMLEHRYQNSVGSLLVASSQLVYDINT